MPGLVGFTSGEGFTKATLARMQSSIQHQPFHKADAAFGDNQFCATRVHTSIVQTSPQPWKADDVCVWLDGEFYNQSELGRRLPGQSDSDSGLLGELYRLDPAFGFLPCIDGIFAAVIYDRARRKLHLITDRYGLRHLYWTTHKRELVWASEVKAVLEIPGFETAIPQLAIEQFFTHGYLLHDLAWLEGVRLLPPGHVLTFDLTSKSVNLSRYWSWDDIKPQPDMSEPEVIGELSRLFAEAVSRRCDAAHSVGVSLSGGLDSRALLGACPETDHPIHVLTFGKAGCEDIEIAREVAAAKGAIHHVVELNCRNWLLRRAAGVWWTDGQNDLGHMHALASVEQQRSFYQVNLNGFLGDAVLGGWYLDNPTWSLAEMIDNRGRRFINEGTRLTNNFFHNRLPFFDNRLMEFTVGLPAKLKRRSYIYNRMLLAHYPLLFRSIRWQKTGVPIAWPAWAGAASQLYRKAKARIARESRRLGFGYISLRDYSDYGDWIRRPPASCVFEKLLLGGSALHAGLLRSYSARKLWDQHLRGADRSGELFRLLTFEIWLQQLYESRYRTEEDDPVLPFLGSADISVANNRWVQPSLNPAN